MRSIFKKEMGQLLGSPAGYVTPAVFALFLGYMYIKDVFVIGSASLKAFFGIAPWLLFIYLPALAMRSLSEERRTNTIEVLLSLPLTERSIIAGKLLALSSLSIISWILTLSIPIVLGVLTGIPVVETIVGYFGVVLLSITYLTFSLYISSRVSNQITSFLVSALVLFFVTTLSSDFLASILPKVIQDLLLWVSPTLHLDNFSKGIIDFRSVVYFVGLSYIFFELTVSQLKKRA